MAQEIRQFSVTLPPLGSVGAPVTYSLQQPPRNVLGVEVQVPDGCNGAVGWQLMNSGQVVIPFDRGEFVVANDQTFAWDLHGYIQTGGWSLLAYNTGFYPHTLQIRYLLDALGTPEASPPPTIISADQLAPVPDPSLVDFTSLAGQ